ncbi:nucleotidyltransferase family protein [Georgenia sunbinii]|uniref:nucleotidyltransferase family protein n=1 Tax=Georgenia sunbinii TaxID=3117728 RepID=UPI002F266B11
MTQRTSASASRAAAQVLVAICRGEPTAVPQALTDVVVDSARHHRVAPLTHVHLRETAPAAAELLRLDRDLAKSLHIRASMLLANVNQLLGDIPWVVFKGPVLSEVAHPVPGLRPYGDLDLLVAPSALRAVSEVLLDAGWVVGDYEDMLRNPQTPGEMHWFTPAGIPVDLHWSMINMESRRRHFEIPTVDLLARRRRVSIGLGSAWTMDEVDTMVHVCLHAALAGANKLGWTLDVDQVARQVTSWDEVAQRALDWGAQAQVALVLRRATATLGTPVPGSFYRSLGVSTALLRIIDAVDRLAPVARQRKSASLSRLLARAVRPGAAATVAAVSRNAARGIVDRIRPVPRRGAAERVAASPGALAAYLEAVEARGSDPAGVASRSSSHRS